MSNSPANMQSLKHQLTLLIYQHKDKDFIRIREGTLTRGRFRINKSYSPPPSKLKTEIYIAFGGIIHPILGLTSTENFSYSVTT